MYDIIGDVHGCYDELIQLIEKLGYKKVDGYYSHPENRQLVFVGDITDRGPKSLAALNFVLKHCLNDKALYVPGNHCDKLYRYFLGRNVQAKHGLETTIEELEHCSMEEQESYKNAFIKLFEKTPYYLVLDKGKLVVSHAGIRGDYIGKNNKQVRTFCLFGDITGEKDERGFPVRRDWAQHYKGKALIVYGHSPVAQPRFINKTVNIDTGCVFGGALTGLRYPELTFEQVPSQLPHVEEKFWTYED